MKINNIDLSKYRPIIEVFTSIEGEGITTGNPTLFVRLSGCNLRCCFDNSICDTAYSSFNPEKGKYTYQSIIDEIEKHPLTKDISITGGEVFLYPEIVRDIIEIAKTYDKNVIVETNGTIAPCPKIIGDIDLINISPKLKSSEPTEEKCAKLGMKMTKVMKNHSKNRWNIDALWDLLTYSQAFRLKYVVGSKNDFEEIHQQIKDLIDYDVYKRNRMKVPLYRNSNIVWEDDEFIQPLNIILMPSGSTNEELDQNRKMVAEYCAKNGFIYSDRLQIVIWGTERYR